jgi:hypothetical protein
MTEKWFIRLRGNRRQIHRSGRRMGQEKSVSYERIYTLMTEQKNKDIARHLRPMH